MLARSIRPCPAERVEASAPSIPPSPPTVGAVSPSPDHAAFPASCESSVGEEEPLRLGTDFSGLDVASIALHDLMNSLSVEVEHVFASDVWNHALRFIRLNHKVQHLYRGIHRRPVDAKHSDLDFYVAGPPCQSWSAAGKRKGLYDPLGRGQLFLASVHFIRDARPRTFILENVPLLRTPHEGTFMSNICAELRNAGYHVSYQTMNTARHGLPHSRPRLYIVGIRQDLASAPFLFPRPLPMPTLAALLNPPCAADSPDGVPSGSTPAALVRAARRRARDEGFVGDWMVSERVSAAWGRNNPPRPECPCLLKAMHVPPFVGSRGRHMTIEEAARMQGLRYSSWRWPSASGQALGLLGNSMSQCVLQRILVRLVRILRPHLDIADPWEDGSALARLTTDAGSGRRARPVTLHRFWKRSRTAPLTMPPCHRRRELGCGPLPAPAASCEPAVVPS